jgi:hypothetical protein
VIRDIEQEDNLAADAMETLDPDKIALALDIRPLDWHLHEQDAAVWLARENAAAAQTAFAQSDELLRESLLQGGDCLMQRRNQLETQLVSLWESRLTSPNLVMKRDLRSH